ncbi:MAG: helix-turn-helix transcriptional regulator [Proteobacteria bacterium]|nr:helix-turn-helix transcriptional regulator [Pseudomonadota bacterium]
MKNFDLIWARDWAALTQAEAAEKMGVHRVTFAQWETGARPMPARKWKLFLSRVAVNPQDIPKQTAPQICDAGGTAVTFERTPCKELNDDDDDDIDDDDVIEVEVLTRSWFEPSLLDGVSADVSKRRLYLSMMLSWQRDPKGMANALRASLARYPYPGESPSGVEERIRNIQAAASLAPTIEMTADDTSRHKSECVEEQHRVAAGWAHRGYYDVHPAEKSHLRQLIVREMLLDTDAAPT